LSCIVSPSHSPKGISMSKRAYSTPLPSCYKESKKRRVNSFGKSSRIIPSNDPVTLKITQFPEVQTTLRFDFPGPTVKMSRVPRAPRAPQAPRAQRYDEKVQQENNNYLNLSYAPDLLDDFSFGGEYSSTLAKRKQYVQPPDNTSNTIQSIFDCANEETTSNDSELTCSDSIFDAPEPNWMDFELYNY
jgi:hypothetical protein